MVTISTIAIFIFLSIASIAQQVGGEDSSKVSHSSHRHSKTSTSSHVHAESPKIYPPIWQRSDHLQQWYQPLDLCLLHDQRNVSIDVIVNDCMVKLPKKEDAVAQPIRCRVGNTWPSKSAYCDPEDIPLAQREHLLSSVTGLDDPTLTPLKEFFQILAKRKGLLLMVGDSVMQQFYSVSSVFSTLLIYVFQSKQMSKNVNTYCDLSTYPILTYLLCRIIK